MTPKLSRRTFLATTGTAGIASLAGCSGNGGGPAETTTTEGDGGGGGDTTTTATDTDGGDGGGGGTTRLSWHAGGTGGTYYPLSNEFKSVVEANTDFTLQVQTTGASVENVGSLAREEADFALIQNDVAFFAANGEGIEAFQGSPVENLRGVATLYPETIHIITLAATGITEPGDLAGQRINTGDLGSGTQVDANIILEALGITDFTEQNTSFSQAADQLRNGDIDAAFVVGGWPVGAIEELATTNDLEIVQIDGDPRSSVMDAAPFFASDTIPGDTYSGISEDRETVSVQAMIATHAAVPEATVEGVTAAIFDNTDQLSIKSQFITAESAQEGMSIDLHPGAQAYFG